MLSHKGVSAISLTAAMSSGVKERLMQESGPASLRSEGPVAQT